MNNNFDNDDEDIVTIYCDDNTEIKCSVVSIYPAGDKQYIALLPLGGEEETNGEVYIYRYVNNPKGECDIENILDDDEYELAADAFDELLDSEEYDEIVSEDELDD